MTIRPKGMGFAILAYLLLSFPAFSQTSTALLSGRVSDPSGAAIPEADVVALNPATNFTMETHTNRTGDYIFPSLPPGTYRVTVSAQGFQQSIVDRLTLYVQDRVTQNVALRIGRRSESVTVTADSQQINTQDATVGTVVERSYASDMPLNGRSFQGLIALAPGVGITSAGSQTPGQFVVNGQRTDTSYFTVDGVSANVAAPVAGSVSGAGTGNAATGSATGGYNTMASLDALEEFKISTSSFAPEFGRTPGGQISVVTRSGTNSFHGDVFEYLRNTVLDANDWFLNAKAKPRGVVQQNDFGGVLGGPLLHNHLFFFGSYEGLRLHAPSPGVTVVPTQAARNLAASLTDNGVLGYMAQFLNAYPLPDGNPTTPCTSSTTCIANYTSSFPTNSQIDTYSGRLDYTINDKMTLFGRYSHAPSSLVSYNTVDATSLLEGSDTYTSGWTWSIKRSMNNEFHFNYSTTTFVQSVLPLNYTGSLATIFPAGYAQPPAEYSANQIGLQFASFAGGVQAFQLRPRNTDNRNGQWNWTDAFSWTKGTHLVKLGLDIRYLYPVFNQANFNANYTFSPTNNCPGGTPAYICGLSSLANIQHNVPQDFRFREYSFFGQDTWKASGRLTLTYGFRWEINPPVDYTNGYPGFSVQASSFSLSDMSRVTLNPFGTPAFPTRWGNFSPRAGVAYQASADQRWGTVIRAGYGVFFDTGNQAFALSSSPWNARCNNTTACVVAPYTGPAVATVQFPISTANQRFAAPPTVPNPPSFPLALGSDNLIDPNYNMPYVHQANLSLEQQLGPHQTMTLSYVGAFGRNLIGNLLYPPNLTNPSELGQGPACAAAPNCGDSLFIIGNYASSAYDALQVKFQREMARGFGFTASYTWSHSIDNGSTNGTLGVQTLPTSQTLAGNQPVSLLRGDSDFDLRHILTLSLVSEIPARFHNAFAKAVLGHWSVDPIYHFQTALPTDIYAIQTGTFHGAVNLFQHPNVVPGVPIYVTGDACAAQYLAANGVRACPGGQALNTAPVSASAAASAGCAAPTATNAKGAFCTPATVGGQAVSGNFGRNIARSHSLQELDLSVHRDLVVFRELRFRFQADMFNVFNHPEFGPLDPLMLDSSFGLSTSMANSSLGSANASGAGFNPTFASGGPRNFQFAAKFLF